MASSLNSILRKCQTGIRCTQRDQGTYPVRMNSGGGLSGYVIINQFGPSVSSKSFLAHRLIWELFSAVFFTSMARSCLARFLWSRSLLKATKLCHSSSFPAYGGGWTCLSVKGNGTNSGSSSSSSSSSGMSFISKFLRGRVAIVVHVYQQNMPVAVYTKNFLEAGASWLAKAEREPGTGGTKGRRRSTHLKCSRRGRNLTLWTATWSPEDMAAAVLRGHMDSARRPATWRSISNVSSRRNRRAAVGGRARQGGRPAQKKRPSLEAGDGGSQRLLRPSLLCHSALAGSPSVRSQEQLCDKGGNRFACGMLCPSDNNQMT